MEHCHRPSCIIFVEEKNRICKFKAGPFTLNLYSLENLIVQRLCSAKYWHHAEDLEQAATLLAAHKDRIDGQYIQRKSEKDKVEDLLQKIKKKLLL